MMNSASATESLPKSSPGWSASPCSPDQVAISPGDCVVDGGVEEWLEDEALAGFRVWQLAGIVLSILLAIIVAMCCFTRFRIPRTKQDIEADYIRKRITKNFRQELSKISNTDMDEMNLREALERVRAELSVETAEQLQRKQQPEEATESSLPEGFRARFRVFIDGFRARFAAKQATMPTATVAVTVTDASRTYEKNDGPTTKNDVSATAAAADSNVVVVVV